MAQLLRESDAGEGKEVVNNGQAPIRFAAILGLCVNLSMVGMMFTMAGFTGTGELAGEPSETLYSLAGVSVIGALLAFYDVYKTFTQIPVRTELVPWEVHHRSLLRMGASMALLVVFCQPAVCTFLLHSLGTKFFDLLEDGLKSDEEERIIRLIVSFFCVMASAALMLPWIRFSLYARFRHKHAAPIDSLPRYKMLSKVLALFSIASSIMYSVILIQSCAEEANSGIIIMTILYLLVALPILKYSWMLLMRTDREKNWLQKFRNVALVGAFLAYMSFWTVLLLLAIVGLGGEGFWDTVDSLDEQKRKDLIYWFMVMMLLYMFAAALRVFYHKFRRKWRLPPRLDKTSSQQDLAGHETLPGLQPIPDGIPAKIHQNAQDDAGEEEQKEEGVQNV